MRVLHLSTTDIHGGAARAAHRIHHALLAAGVESRLGVQVKTGDEWHVHTHPHAVGRAAANLGARLRTGLVRRCLRPASDFSTQLFSSSGIAGLRRSDVDIINLHWVCDGFLGIGELGRQTLPVVWTLHDQWPFTGGCHYSSDCDRFTQTCGKCPVLGEKFNWGVSRIVHRIKKRRWKRLDISVVSPSRWLAQQAARSSLFRDRDIRVIPYPIDLQVFRPVPREHARALLGLELSRPTLLFVAMSATTGLRKGFDLFENAINQLQSILDHVQLIVIGASEPGQISTDHRRIHYLGRLHDDVALALAYSAADVFVAPSRQDNLPNTVIESLACGTPVAAFRVGGMPDMIEHQLNGILAEPFDARQLAHGISTLLATDRREELSANSRASAENLFAPHRIAAKYIELYSSFPSVS